jgi:hypothetical protein
LHCKWFFEWINWDSDVLSRLFWEVETGRIIHKTTQFMLEQLGKDYGFFSEINVKVDD